MIFGASPSLFLLLLLLLFLESKLTMEARFLEAARNGRVEEVEEILRNNPTFNVNCRDEDGDQTALYHACKHDRGSVVSILLAHPGIDVNVKDEFGCTPFYYACVYGSTLCVREMLKDSRVKVNSPNNDGSTPLSRAAWNGSIDIIRWWIASGREMDLGKPGNSRTDTILVAKNRGKPRVATLLERFKENPVETRHAMRVELGLLDVLAAEMFALVVFVSDGLLQIKNLVDSTPPAARFLRISTQLPLELQMVLCYRVLGSAKEIISGKDSEVAFKRLAKRI